MKTSWRKKIKGKQEPSLWATFLLKQVVVEVVNNTAPLRITNIIMESLIFQKPNTVTVLISQGAQSAEVVLLVIVGGQPVKLMPER